jgi:hypothetical protein
LFVVVVHGCNLLFACVLMFNAVALDGLVASLVRCNCAR